MKRGFPCWTGNWAILREIERKIRPSGTCLGAGKDKDTAVMPEGRVRRRQAGRESILKQTCSDAAACGNAPAYGPLRVFDHVQGKTERTNLPRTRELMG